MLTLVVRRNIVGKALALFDNKTHTTAVPIPASRS